MDSVLVIDDEPGVRRLVRQVLGARGFQVLEAANGVEGLDECARERPSLVLSDIVMPGMDGFETLRRIRSDPATAPIAVILMTGSGDTNAMRRGMELGADDFLFKPFETEQLVEAIRSRLSRQRELAARGESQIAALRETISSSLSHELRTPLNAILGFSAILAEGDPFSPSEVVEMAQSIHRAGRRLARLVERRLAFAGVELLAASPDLRAELSGRESVDVTSLVGKVARRVAREARRVDDLVLRGDDLPARLRPEHVESIAEELADNAFKFSPPGSPVRVETSRSGSEVVLAVSDGGPGFTAEDRASLGTFVQPDRRHREQQGLGLGLALASRTAQLYGGRLVIEAPEAGGSRVLVHLPASDPDPQ